MENRNNSAAIWAIFTKFGVMVDMDSLQRAITTIFDLYKNPRCLHLATDDRLNV